MNELLIVAAITCMIITIEYINSNKMSWYVALYWFITSLFIFCFTIYRFVNWLSIITWVAPLLVSSWNMIDVCSKKLDSIKWFK